MPQDGDERVFHRANNSLGHFRFGKIENRMDRSDREIQFRQYFVAEIKLAIAQDVAFDPGEEPEPVKALIQFSDRRDLRVQLGCVDSMRLDRTLAMFSDP